MTYLSELRVDYYEPEGISIDPILYRLTDGDISKIEEVLNIDVELCYEWNYILKIREINELRLRIAEWRKIKGNS